MAARKQKSKKRSGANSPPEEIVFFIDRSLGHSQLANSLRALGEVVITHDEKFPSDTPDDVWLKEAGRKGWVVLTHDTRIRYRKMEREALIENNTKAFVLTAKCLRGHEIAEVFVNSIASIKKLVGKYDNSLIATISRSSSVTVKYP
jgi:hypothetical protein